MLLCLVRTSTVASCTWLLIVFLPHYSKNKGLSSELIRIVVLLYFSTVFINQLAVIIKLNVSSYCRFRPKFTSTAANNWVIFQCDVLMGRSAAWWAGRGAPTHVGVWMEWFVKMWCWTTQPMKVIVKVWWGSGVLCNIQELYMVWFPRGIVKNGTSLSLHFLRGNSLRIEWTCNVFSSIFGSLGDWNVSGTWVSAHFLSYDFGCGLNFFSFGEWQIWAQLCKCTKQAKTMQRAWVEAPGIQSKRHDWVVSVSWVGIWQQYFILRAIPLYCCSGFTLGAVRLHLTEDKL